MGVTRFPYGLSVAAEGDTEFYPLGSTSQGVRAGSLAGTVITGAGTIAPSAFGLTAATWSGASFGGTGTYAGTAAGVPQYVQSFVSGGSVVVRCYDNVGTQASGAGTVNVQAFGT